MNFAVRFQDAASIGEGAVVLAEVDAVGTDAGGECGVVVEDEWNSGGSAKRDEPTSDALDGGEIVVFRAELKEIGTTGEKGGGDSLGTLLGDVAEVEDGVKASGVETGHRMR